MQRTHSILILMLCMALGLSSGCKKISSREDLDQIRALEKRADEERALIMTGEADTALLGELGRAYVAFADKFPEAAETPEFLFRAGELYSNDLGNLNRALEIFHRNYSEYPQHETAASALFLLAYLNHNVLQDLEEAEKHYRTYLEQYPGHKMAATAEFELEHLGQSPEDIFNSFNLEEKTPGQTP